MAQSSPPHAPPQRWVALRVALVYALFGGLWIIFSDRALESLIHDSNRLTDAQTYKGWFYVLATAAGLYLFLAYYAGRMREYAAHLRESESRYHSLFDRVPVKLYRTTPAGQILDVNPALARLLGYTDRDKILSLTARDFYVDPNDRTRWQSAIDRADVLYAFETQIRCADGSILWVADTARVVRDETGRPLYYEGSLEDITARKQAEAALQDREAQYRVLFEHANDAIMVIRNGVYVDCNAKMVELFGAQDRTAILGKPPQALSPEYQPNGQRSEDEVRRRIAAAMKGESQTFEWLHQRLDGTLVDVEISLSPVKLRDETLIVSLGRDITARKRDEEALRESEERLDLALQGADLGLWDWEVQTGKTVFNQQWAETIGYALDDLGNRAGLWETLLHPDDKGRVMAALNDHLEGRTPVFECEYRLQTRTGEWKWVLDRGKVVQRDASGQPLRMTGTHLDITARKQAEAALATERNLLRTLIDNLPDRIYVKDAERRHLICNLADARAKGAASPDDVIGKTDYDFYSPALAARYAADDRAVIEQGEPLINREEPTPQTGWMLTTKVPLRDPEGNVIGLVGVGRDITERRYIENELRRARDMLEQRVEERTAELAAERNLLRTLIDSLPDYIYVKDAAGRFIVVNKAMAESRGHASVHDMVGATDFDFFPREMAERFYVDEQQLFATGQPLINQEEPALNLSGDPLWVLTTKTPLRDPDGNITHLIGISRDITEQKRAADALQQAHNALAAERNLLRTLIDNLPDAIYVKDCDSRFVTVNMAVMQRLGAASLEDIIGHTDFDFYPPDQAETYRADERKLFKTGQPIINKEEPGLSRDSEQHWLWTTKVPLRDPQGDLIGLVGIGRDITERKQAAETLQQAHNALAAERNLLRTLIDNLPDAVYVKDMAGRFLISNQIMVRLQDVTSSEAILGKTDFDLYPREMAEQFYADEQALFASGEPIINKEERNPGTGNRPEWVLTTKVPLRDNEGQLVGLVGIGRDITERKRMENALRQARDELEQRVQERTAELSAANARMATRARELATVAEVSRQATTILDEQQLLWTVCDLVRDNFDLYQVQIYLFDAAQQQLVLAAGAGEVGRKLQGLAIPITAQYSLVARTARQRQPVIVNDILHEPDFLSNPLVPDSKSELAMPMIVGETLVGVLNIEDDTVDRFTDEDVSIQTTLAAQIAIAIHNARLFTENARRLAIIENSDALIALADLRESPSHIHYINPAGKRLLGYDSDDDLTRVPVEEFFPPDNLTFARTVALPNALAEGQWRGETTLKRKDGTRVPVEQMVFTIPDEHGQIHDIATIVYDITERQQLLTRLATRARELATVAEVSRQATTILDVDQLLWTVCNLVKDNFDLYHAHIYLLDNTGETLVLSAGAGEIGQQLVAAHHHIPITHEVSLVASAARTGTAVVVNDVAQTRTYMPNVLLPHTKSELAIPMLVGQTVIGVLDVQASTLDRFSPEDVDIQSTLAAQIAIAIHNARLFTENARRLAIIENTDALIALADLRSRPLRPLYINPAGQRLLGVTAEDFAAHLVQDFYPADTLNNTWNEALETALDQGLWRGENVVKHQDGRLIPVEQTIFVIPGPSGAPRDVATIVTDITERKRAEEALRRANRSYRMLSDANQIMVRSDNEPALLSEISEKIVNSGNYRMAWVGLRVPDDAETVRWAAHAGFGDGNLPVLEAASKELVQTVIRSRQPCVVADLLSDPVFASWHEQLQAEELRSAIILPLNTASETLGTLSVYATKPNIFDDEEIALLDELAGDLAYGITTLRTRAERERAEAELHQSQANLLALIENTQDAIWLIDTQGRLVAMNSVFKQSLPRIKGFELEPGQQFAQFLPPTNTASWDAYYMRALQGNRFVDEIDYPIPEGGVGTVEVSFNPVRSADGTITGVAVYSHNITDRKRTEEQLRQLNTRLAERNHALVALNEIGRTLAATLDTTEIYRVLHREVVQNLLASPHLLVALYDETTQSITCDFAVVDDQETDTTQFPPVPLGEGPNSETIKTGQPRIVDLKAIRAGSTPGTLMLVGSEREPQSALYVPMFSGDRVIGVLNVQRYDEDAFTHEDLTLLSIVANQAAVAIQNARLFAAERDQRALAEALRDTASVINQTLEPNLVLDRVLDNLKDVVPHDAASIMLIDQGIAQVVRATGFAERGLEQWIGQLGLRVETNGVLRAMAESGEPHILADTTTSPAWEHFQETQWQASYAAAPIRREGTVIGFLNVYSTTPGFFADFHGERLQVFADQVAMALHNARLFASIQQHAAELQTQTQHLALVNRISTQLAQTLDLNEIYRIGLLELQQITHSEFGGLVLFDSEEAGHLVLDTHPQSDTHALARIPLRNNPSITLVCETHKPVVSGNVLNDSRFEPVWDVLRARGTRALVIAPLVVGNEVIGTIGLDSNERRVFTANEIELVETVANQTSLAIANAQLYQAEREQRAMAEALRDTATAINSTLNIDELLDRILENLGRVVPHDAANIMLIKDGIAQIARGNGYEKYGQGEWIRQYRFGISEIPVWQQMLVTREPFAIPDTRLEPKWLYFAQEEWIRSSVKAPIVLDGTTIGILHADSATPNTFDHHHAERLQAFADQAAIALRNARLFAAEHEQRTLAEALRDTAAAVNSTLDFDTVLDRILTTVERIAPHDMATILLIEGNVARVRRSYSRTEIGKLENAEAFELQVETTANLRQMVETGQPVIIEHTDAYPGWLSFPEIAWIRSHAGTPIRHNQQVIGFLTLDSHQPGFYHPDLADRLQAFADQIAVALENARLFDLVQRNAVELEALRRITLDITRQLDLSAVLQSVVKRGIDLLRASGGGVYLYRPDRDILEWVMQAGKPELPLGKELKRGEGLSGKVWDSRAPLIANNYRTWVGRAPFVELDQSNAVIGVPILWGDEFLGVLLVDSAEDLPNRIFDAYDAHLLSLLASQTAIAIKNAQLFEAINSHAAELEQRVQERTAELETQRHQLQVILDTMGEALVYTAGTQVLYVNRAYTELFGFESSEIMDDSLQMYTHVVSPMGDTRKLQAKIDAVLQQGQSWRGEVRLQRKDQTVFDAAMTTSQVSSPDDSLPRRTVSIFRDISQEKRLQEQKDRFIANASHELRTPLANIKTRLYLLRKQPDKFDQHVTILDSVTDTMTELVENLLDVSRFERGIIPLVRRMIVLQELIQAVVTIQQPEAERKRITLRTVLPDAPVRVSVDPKRITQVITNLITNAINYTPEEGHVTVEITLVDNQQVEICVRDTGIGIAPDALQQVFEPFFRANEIKATGTGLGLTITREIVHLHGGEIRVESEVGQGSVFTITLDTI
jgi:PAS domain S-box-containing protein